MIAWVADRSQITRLGIITLLKQLGHQLSIREMASPEKFISSVPKTSNNLLIISSSFLSLCKGSVQDLLALITAYPARVLIRDQQTPEAILNVFGNAIHPDDPEKAILKLFEGQIEGLLKKSGSHQRDSEISDREKEVLQLVAMGLTNKEIAEKLFISTHTVITHRKNITAKLGIKTIAGLSVYAVINKLISIGDIQ